MMNLGATLVRGLRRVLEGMQGVRSYIDHLFIYSDSWEDHLRTLKELFGRLIKVSITARPTKCQSNGVLGKEVRDNVITPSHDNLEKVRNILRPTTKKQVRSFSGMLGYYRYHIPAVADRDLITIDRPSKEAKSRMYPVERDTGTCVFPNKGIPAAGASPEASRLNKAIRTMDRRIWSWGGGCATTGNDGMLYPMCFASKKVNLTEANTREGMPWR